MRTQPNFTLRFLVFSALVLSGCHAPQDVSHTLSDLEVLKQRVEHTHPDYSFRDLSLLNDVSQSTLDFISQRFAADEVNDFAKMFPALNQHFGAHKQVNAQGEIVLRFSKDLDGFYNQVEGGSLRLSPQGLESITPARGTPEAQVFLQGFYSELSKRHSHVWGDDKWEARVYCEEECACTAKALGDELKSRSLFAHVLYVKVTPAQGQILKNDWTYHVAALVGDLQSGWSVVDHRLFQDDELHSLAQWKHELDPATLAQYQVSVNVKKFLLGR